MDIKNAIIESVCITNDDHGILSIWVNLKFDGCGQGFGGYALYLPNNLNQKNYAGHFIWRVMEIAEVSEWSHLRGKIVRAKADYSKVHAIGHIIKDDWFDPTMEFEAL